MSIVCPEMRKVCWLCGPRGLDLNFTGADVRGWDDLTVERLERY